MENTNNNIRINFLNQHGDFCNCQRCQMTVNEEKNDTNFQVEIYFNNPNLFFDNSYNSYDFFGLPYSTYYSSPYFNPNIQDRFIHYLFQQSQHELERNEKVKIDVEAVPFKNTEKTFTNCTICSDDYNDEDIVSVLDCKHVFHKNCIDEWGHYNPVCPVCKASIKTK